MSARYGIHVRKSYTRVQLVHVVLTCIITDIVHYCKAYTFPANVDDVINTPPNKKISLYRMRLLQHCNIICVETNKLYDNESVVFNVDL